MCSTQLQPDNSLIKIIGWIVPFLLGLSASFIIDKVRNQRAKSKNIKFIRFYLGNTILKNLPKLKTDYELIKDKIEKFEPANGMTLSAHEDFNTNVLNGLTYVQYYEIFKDDFVFINEIISMIEYMSQFLPSKLWADHWSEINMHLKEKDKVGDRNHIVTCGYCGQKKDEIISLLNNRIKETDILKDRIGRILK